MMENKGVLVYCEANGDSLAAITMELLGAGTRLAVALGAELSAVLIGSDTGGLARRAIDHGANKVYVVDEPFLKDYLTESYLSVLEKVVQQTRPSIILLGHNLIGRDLAPWLAFNLNSGASLDCLALEIDPATDRLLMTRPVYGGNAQVVQICESDPQIATVRIKAMTALNSDSTRQGQIIQIAVGIDQTAFKTRVLEMKIETTVGIKLEDARVVVSGGRGMGNITGFKQLEEIARLLKGAVGATRPPCDNKWIGDTQQIGLTGKVVSPDLYIAVGLSGASQHLSGCSSSKIMIAINKDPEANIFKVADYGIIGDWKAVLPALSAKLKEVIG
jgi:electron transfer flavoprotein alpha subunit